MRKDNIMSTEQKKKVYILLDVLCVLAVSSAELEHAAVPILTVLSNQTYPDFCQVTLRCTGSDVSLTYTCSITFHHTPCQQDGTESFLSFSSNQSTVSCNHSNPVSWSLNTIELQPLCPSYNVSPPETVHLDVLAGSTVRLDVTYQASGERRILRWYYNNIRFSTQTLYYDLGEVLPQLTFNAQKSDSGFYMARIFPTIGSLLLYEDTYQLSVYERAAVPILTVLSNQSSPDSCHVTLSCTGSDVSLTTNCSRTSNGDTVCSQDGTERFLSITSNQSTVSCNHSNPVSWSLDTIELQPLCPFFKGLAEPTEPDHVVGMRLAVSSAERLNETAVEEQILKPLRDLLRERGVDVSGIRLRRLHQPEP